VLVVVVVVVRHRFACCHGRGGSVEGVLV
jgi:hypothetical protein